MNENKELTKQDYDPLHCMLKSFPNHKFHGYVFLYYSILSLSFFSILILFHLMVENIIYFRIFELVYHISLIYISKEIAHYHD